MKRLNPLRRSLVALAAYLALAGPVFAVEPARSLPDPSGIPQGFPAAIGDPIAVRVVSAADCANTPPTMKLIEMVAQEMGLRVEVTRQIATTPEEAAQYRFFGSPTVQIDGLDLEAAMRTDTHYVLS